MLNPRLSVDPSGEHIIFDGQVYRDCIELIGFIQIEFYACRFIWGLYRVGIGFI